MWRAATEGRRGAAEAPPLQPADAPRLSLLQQPSRSHPAGERQGKRVSALAENLKRWLKGRSEKS